LRCQTDYLQNSVSLIDTATQQVVAGFSVPSPTAIAFTPDGKYAYVASHCGASDPPITGTCTENAILTVIDTATLAAVATHPIGTQTFSVAFTPDGKLAYVVGSYSHNVTVIDTATQSVIATIVGFAAPYSAAVTPDGKYVWITNNVQDNVSGFVSIVDTATQAIVHTISVPRAWSVAITQDGKHAWVSQGTYFVSEGTVLVIDTATRAVVGGPIEVGSNPFRLALQPTPFLAVDIDIRPGAFPNTINLKASGIVPVAILSSATFDATQVKPESITLAGAHVRLLGKGHRYACSSEDVNGDGRVDLVCNVIADQLQIQPGDSDAVLEADTLSGVKIRGQDSIRIVAE
jgi:YVTN family beta-propeller protein